jgi:hypothetical protein
MSKVDFLYVVETTQDGEVVGVCSKLKHLETIFYNYLWFDEVVEIGIVDTEELNTNELKVIVYVTLKSGAISVEEFYVTSINNIIL